MKQYGLLYKNFQEMQSFIDNARLKSEKNILIQIFTGIIQIEFIQQLINEITRLLPQAEIIGTTTAGEIFEGKSLHNQTILSFSTFQNVKIKTKLIHNDHNEFQLGQRIVHELVSKDTKVLIMFSDGLETKGTDIIKGIQSENSNIAVCGGKAGDNGYFRETFVFTKDYITQSGCAAASLSGKNLNIMTGYSFCWSPIGKLMTITKASGNKIETIDNIKAVDIYKKYLGEEIAKELPLSATEFPLIFERNGFKVGRVAFDCHDDGAMSFLGDVREGDQVRFGYGNINAIKTKAIDIVNDLIDKKIEGIFVYSCSVRKSFLQNRIEMETIPLNQVALAMGFFTYGEIFSVNQTNELLNVTMTILGMSEGTDKSSLAKPFLIQPEKRNENFFEGKELGAIEAFTNLVNQVTKELQEANVMLEEQKSKIEQIKNITNAIMEINNEIVASGKIESLLQMILNKAIDIIPNAQMGSILMLEDKRLVYKATNGYCSGVEDVNYALESTYHFQEHFVRAGSEPMIVNNLEKRLFKSKDDFEAWEKRFFEVPTELLSCTIHIDGKAKGLINLFNTRGKDLFEEEDKPIIKHLASEITMAMKNAKLLENTIYMSRFDCLTGLYNRSYFRSIADQIFQDALLFGESFIMAVIDLNNLKWVNDTYGHDAGDIILKKFAKVFKSQIDVKDVIGKTGGDEFEVIFKNKKMDEVIEMIEGILDLFKNEFVDGGGSKEEISFAYGLSEFPNDSANLTVLNKIADRRMYENKKKMKG